MRTANRFPAGTAGHKSRQPTTVQEQHGLLSFFSLSSMADRSLRLKILRFPFRSSSLRSTTDTSGKIACPIREVSRYHPNFPSLALLLVSTDGVALPKIREAPCFFARTAATSLASYRGTVSLLYAPSCSSSMIIITNL